MEILNQLDVSNFVIASAISVAAYYLLRPLFRSQPKSHLEVYNIRFRFCHKVL